MTTRDRDSLYRISQTYLKRKREAEEARRKYGETTEDFYAAHAQLLRACRELGVDQFETAGEMFTVQDGSVAIQRISRPRSFVLGVRRFLGSL